MKLPKFKYIAPTDIKETCAVLNEYSGRIAVCAGGTELVMHLKWRLKTPQYLLSLKNLIGLKDLKFDQNSGLVLGATVSMRNLATNALIKSEGMGALAQGADGVGTPHVRNIATIGGNVCLDARCWYYDRSKQWRESSPPCYKAGGDRCHVMKGGKRCYALFQADTVPSLLILRAKLKLVNSAGIRILPVEEFYSGRGEAPNRLSPDEILTEIHIPKPPSNSSTAYLKYSKRGAIDFPILGLASLVRLDREGKQCQEARFALTGVDTKPILIEATGLLAGLDRPLLTEDLVSHLLEDVKPITHMGVSASLKRRMARAFLKKAFRETWDIARSTSDRYK